MAKKVKRLTALKVSKTAKPGWYPDGDGLYLQVSKTGTKSWVYRYEKAGKERRHGLGSYTTVGLEDARKAAQVCRDLRHDGIDPIEHRKREATRKELEKAKTITFRECALAYIDSHKSGWKSRKHESQWRNTLQAYAYPTIGEISVQDVDIGLILAILEPLWNEKTETATRVRQRIENVLDWATVRKYRTGENPARWRGHLDKLLPKRTKVQKVQHFPAMPYMDVSEYFRGLRMVDTLAARALALTILTATRNSEAREARWQEIDLNNKVWEIPAGRMKAERTHRIPLSDEAVKILNDIKPISDNDYLFPSIKRGKPISEATVRKQLRKTHNGLTVHGFRSSFRDWCAEMTGYPREVAEAALAHVIKDKTEAAYQRGDIFEKRRKLMNAWADYLVTFKRRGDILEFKKSG